MDDLKQKTVRGAFAKFWSQAALTIFRIGSLMVLARLLDPRDFGLVAMVTVVTGIFRLFQDAGLSLVTIQRSTITKGQVSTLFWMNILVGTGLSFLTLVTAPLVVSFYHEPRLLWITVVLSSGFLINAAGVQHAALLQRQMRFTTLAWIEVLSSFMGTIVSIGMAMGGLGYWALVAIAIIPTVVATICFWLTEAWVPGPPHRDAESGSMFRFGGKVTLNGIVLYYSMNLDKVLLGRFWGTEVLGIYGRAYQLIMIPRDYIASAIGVVAVASLSRLHADPPRFKSYLLRGYSLMLALLLPITIATALFADEIILFFLGPAWKDAAVVLRLLAPTILVIGSVHPIKLVPLCVRVDWPKLGNIMRSCAFDDSGLFRGFAPWPARRRAGSIDGHAALDRAGHPMGLSQDRDFNPGRYSCDEPTLGFRRDCRELGLRPETLMRKLFFFNGPASLRDGRPVYHIPLDAPPCHAAEGVLPGLGQLVAKAVS